MMITDKYREYNKKYVRTIRWYTNMLPYIYIIEQLSYNTKTGNVTFTSNMIMDDKYVRSEKKNKEKNKEKNKKFKMGRP